MKKLLVVQEETNSNLSQSISEFLSMQYNYGLYDFNTEKLLEDMSHKFKIKVAEINPPYYKLIDNQENNIVLEFLDDAVL